MASPIHRPNFVIGGAPKGGTTALANYLRDHEQVFFSELKEPFYWATDFPSSRQATGIEKQSDYLGLFNGVNSKHLAIGEGSTLYLYSQVAIQKIMEWEPTMKFIFMLRRPNEVAHAYHMQMSYSQQDDLQSFPDAWDAQEQRRSNPNSIPPRCIEPAFLDYAAIASIGTQIQRAAEIIPPDQMHVILFDDFVRDTGKVYRQSLEFLGVPDDGRQLFSRENAAMKARFPIVTRVLRSKPVVHATAISKRYLKGSARELARKAKHGLMFQRTPRASLPDDFAARLHEHFVPEIELLERTIGRDLNYWKVPKS